MPAREVPERPRDHADARLTPLRWVRPVGVRGYGRARERRQGNRQDGPEHRVPPGNVREDRTEEVSGSPFPAVSSGFGVW